MLAECYLAENKVYKLVALLKDASSDMNRYRLAVALLKVNKDQEAERVLTNFKAPYTFGH